MAVGAHRIKQHVGAVDLLLDLGGDLRQVLVRPLVVVSQRVRVGGAERHGLRVEPVAKGERVLRPGDALRRVHERPVGHGLAHDERCGPRRPVSHECVVLRPGRVALGEGVLRRRGDDVLEHQVVRLRGGTDFVDEVEESTPVGRSAERLGRAGTGVRCRAVGDHLEDLAHLVVADLLHDPVGHEVRGVVAVRLDLIRTGDEVRVSPVVERHLCLVRDVGGGGQLRGAAEVGDGTVGVHLGQSLVEPAIGEPGLREPRMRQLVEHDLGVEVLADLQLLLHGAEPTGIAVQVRRERLADGDGAVDRPWLTDERRELGHAGRDLGRHERLPRGVVRPAAQVESFTLLRRHRRGGQCGVSAGRDEDVEVLRVRDVGRGVGRGAVVMGGRRVAAEHVHDEPVGHHDLDGDVPRVALAEGVEGGIGGVHPGGVDGAGWKISDVVGEPKVGGLSVVQARVERDVVEQEVLDVRHGSGTDCQPPAGCSLADHSRGAGRCRYREPVEVAAGDGVPAGDVGELVRKRKLDHHVDDARIGVDRVDDRRGDGQPLVGMDIDRVGRQYRRWNREGEGEQQPTEHRMIVKEFRARAGRCASTGELLLCA